MEYETIGETTFGRFGNSTVIRKLKVLRIFAFLILTITVSCGQNTAEPEIYYIPAEFRGKVLIVLDVKQGSSPVYKNSARVYSINNDGVFLTQLKVNAGYHNDVYKQVKFYLTGKKDTLELPVLYGALDSIPETKDNEVHVFSIHNGKYGNYRYISFFVDTLEKGKKYPDKAFSDDSDVMDDLLKKYKLIN